MINETDRKHLKRCVELARIALTNGNEPFGSILVSESGEVLFEDHNRVAGGDQTKHPEFAIARWAASYMTPEERSKATVYTSGEHCPMCAAAHAWVGLDRIVYASSSKQLQEWKAEWDAPQSPIYNLSIQEVIRVAEVDGPVPELAEEVKELHRQSQERNN
ncbi:nucleoside deaminase [Alkalibacterium putridalgicola]|uniref:nucleoside deaminase n=1 Tax=Alkalibacterium putridalgicola TaxID=426703 RepID=UPI0034CDFE59